MSKSLKLKFLSRSDIVGISILQEVLLSTAIQEYKHFSSVFLKGKPAHLEKYNHFKRDVNQDKNTSVSQLYQLPSAPFYRTSTTGYFRSLPIFNFLNLIT